MPQAPAWSGWLGFLPVSVLEDITSGIFTKNNTQGQEDPLGTATGEDGELYVKNELVKVSSPEVL